MAKAPFSKSDRRALLLLLGVMTITALIITLHEPEYARKNSWNSRRDSLIYHKKEDSLRRAARYQAVKDSFALLKAQRQQRKLQREAAYRTMMDSFAALKRQREVAKAEREAEWARKKDSLQSLRPAKLSRGERIDVNSGDTLTLQKIPGIGPAYAKAIVNYREKLGGYYNVKQVLEINGIQPESVEYLEIGAISTRKININKATINQLRSHPYINFYQAKAIVTYRNKYGNISDLQQLRLLDEFADADISRITPYLQY